MSSAYTKKILEQVGGFAEDYAYGGEDVELDAKIAAAGHKLYYLPEGTVYHKHRSSFKGFVRQMTRLGRGCARIKKKYPGYLPLQYHGPAVLCVISVTPLLVIPLSMALLNGIYTGLRERNAGLFLPLVLLTWTFYVCYGYGDLAQMVGGGK